MDVFRRREPQHEMSLRTIDDREVRLLDGSNDTLATLQFSDAIRDAHPGAIYHHQGQRYEVSDLDLERCVARLQPTWADHYTRVLTEKTIEVEADREERYPFAHDVPVRFADITLTTAVTGYERRDPKRGETIDTLSPEPPGADTRHASALLHRATRRRGGATCRWRPPGRHPRRRARDDIDVPDRTALRPRGHRRPRRRSIPGPAARPSSSTTATRAAWG